MCSFGYICHISPTESIIPLGPQFPYLLYKAFLQFIIRHWGGALKALKENCAAWLREACWSPSIVLPGAACTSLFCKSKWKEWPAELATCLKKKKKRWRVKKMKRRTWKEDVDYQMGQQTGDGKGKSLKPNHREFNLMRSLDWGRKRAIVRDFQKCSSLCSLVIKSLLSCVPHTPR